MRIYKYTYITLFLIISTLFLSCKEEATVAVESDLSEQSSSSLEVIPEIEFSYEEVTNPTTGKIWIDRNLGASKVAESSTDSLAYGDSYQWGRAADGHEKRNYDKTSTLSNSYIVGHGKFIISSDQPFDWLSPQNDSLWQGIDGINNPCPSNYRLPTKEEWIEEMTTWSSQDAEGAFESSLKLTMAGYHYRSYGAGSSALGNVGVIGYYWSSTVSSTEVNSLNFSISQSTDIKTHRRASGLSVRCIKD